MRVFIYFRYCSGAVSITSKAKPRRRRNDSLRFPQFRQYVGDQAWATPLPLIQVLIALDFAFCHRTFAFSNSWLALPSVLGKKAPTSSPYRPFGVLTLLTGMQSPFYILFATALNRAFCSFGSIRWKASPLYRGSLPYEDFGWELP